jgi:hypothetical protein
VIYEEESRVVLRVFVMFDEGVSLVEIARRLNADNVPAPLDTTQRRNVERGWRPAGVKAILGNARYVGRFAWNQSGGGRLGRRVARPATEHIVDERPELAIVPLDLWTRVEARLAARKSGRPPGSGAKVYFTTGLPRCGACGSPMSIGASPLRKGGRYASHQCGRARVRGTCTNRAMLAERRLSAALLDALRSTLTRPEVADEFVRLVESAIEAAAAAPGPADAERRLREAESRVARIAAAIASVPDSEALLAQLANEETAVRAARAECTAATRAAGAPRTPPSRSAVRTSISAFVDALGTLAPERANAVLRDGFGPAGLTCTPEKLTWLCTGSLRLGPVLANSESRSRGRCARLR